MRSTLTMKQVGTLKVWMVILGFVLGVVVLQMMRWQQPSQAQPSPPDIPSATTLPTSVSPAPTPLGVQVKPQITLQLQPLPSPAKFRASEVRGMWIHTYAPFD